MKGSERPVVYDPNTPMPTPLILDLLVALLCTALAFLAAVWASATPGMPAAPAREAAVEAGEAARGHSRARALLTRRFDRSVATGFLLTVSLGFVFAAGLVLGLLALLVRTQPALNRGDRSIAAWGYHHRTPFSTHGLNAITQLGNIKVVLVLAVTVAAVDLFRTRNRWSGLFLVVVLVGMELLSTGVKDLVSRTRPTFVPAAAHLGPSFPSGHSATAAAFWAAAALILGRGLARRGRRALAAAAVGVAVAVAASRVLLDLHWTSDVVGGLALGWGWFALCALVFGGRLLRPTAAVDTAAAAASAPPSVPTAPAGRGSSAAAGRLP
jgi:undecaprenyl-diphosphatase